MIKYKYEEEHLDEVTYPAKLKPEVKRLLVAKSYELRRAHNEQVEALESERRQATTLRREVPIKQLTGLAKKLALRQAKARDLFTKLTEDMKKLGMEPSYTTQAVYVKAAEADILRAKAEYQAKIDAETAVFHKAENDLIALARSLATVEIEDTKRRIAKADPALVSALENLGKPALKPAKPVKELSAKVSE